MRSEEEIRHWVEILELVEGHLYGEGRVWILALKQVLNDKPNNIQGEK